MQHVKTEALTCMVYVKCTFNWNKLCMHLSCKTNGLLLWDLAFDVESKAFYSSVLAGHAVAGRAGNRLGRASKAHFQAPLAWRECSAQPKKYTSVAITHEVNNPQTGSG